MASIVRPLRAGQGKRQFFDSVASQIERMLTKANFFFDLFSVFHVGSLQNEKGAHHLGRPLALSIEVLMR
jgi:hypothetical protein